MFHTFPDTPIFDLVERESVEADRYASPYAGITKAQLVGLLWALGECMTRSVSDTPDPTLLKGAVSDDSEFVAAHRSLYRFYRWIRRPDTDGTASRGEPLFDTQERSTLALFRYVRGCENVSKQDVRVLLEALGRYCLKAPVIRQPAGPHQLLVRLVHAHNALVSFRNRPFDVNEFRESVRAVLRGKTSLIARSNRDECEIV